MERKDKKQYWIKKNIRLHRISPRDILKSFCTVMRVPVPLPSCIDQLLDPSCSLDQAAQDNLQKGLRAEVWQLAIPPESYWNKYVHSKGRFRPYKTALTIVNPLYQSDLLLCKYFDWNSQICGYDWSLLLHQMCKKKVGRMNKVHDTTTDLRAK